MNSTHSSHSNQQRNDVTSDDSVNEH